MKRLLVRLHLLRPGDRLLLVQPGVTTFLAVLYLAILGISVTVQRRLNIPARESPFLNWSATWLLIFAAFHGFFRSRAFPHAGYWQWLGESPWTSKAPLPFAPAHLVFRDALVLALLVVLARYVSLTDPLSVLMVFTAAYLIRFVFLLSAEAPAASILLLFGFGALIRLIHYPEAGTAILVLMYLIAWAGQKQALRAVGTFSTADPTKVQRLAMTRRVTVPLGPTPPPAPWSLGVSLLVAALSGWWCYCLVALAITNADSTRLITTGLTCVSVLIALVRLLVFVSECAAPITVPGRIFTGRWIIPGYDKIFVAPCVVALVGYVVPRGLASLGLPPDINAGLSLATVMFTAIALPPSRYSWRLTGQYRVVPPLRRQRDRDQLDAKQSPNGGTNNWSQDLLDLPLPRPAGARPTSTKSPQ